MEVINHAECSVINDVVVYSEKTSATSQQSSTNKATHEPKCKEVTEKG